MEVEQAVPSLELASTIGTGSPAIETLTLGRLPQAAIKMAARIAPSGMRDRTLVQDRALHLADEFVDLERLPADICGTEKARDLMAIGAAADDDDRHFVGVRPPLTPARDELGPVVIRKPKVEDDGCGRAREGRSERLTSVNRRDHVETSAGEGLGDQPTGVVVILDDEDASIKPSLHPFSCCHQIRPTANAGLVTERYMPRNRSASGTSKRFAKCARAERDGATRPVSIFHTYCRWK